MRFLYGDSSPFPLGYNFLATLEAFMTASTRIVQLDVEANAIEEQHSGVIQSRVIGLEALDSFHEALMSAVEDATREVQNEYPLQYARALATYGSRYIEEHRASTLATNESEALKVRAERDLRATEMKAHLEAFLKVARLPVVKTKLAMALSGDPKDARYSGNVSAEHPDGITTAFTIAPHRTAVWNAPRKVSDFVQGVELKVGVEKSWLRGTVSLKQLSVDDWTIAQIDLTDETFDVTLRRKPSDKEALSFHLRRSESGVVSGAVEHPGVAEAEPAQLADPDLGQLERMWLALKTATREVTLEKELLLGVFLDGQHVFEKALAVPLVARLVGMFAPTVREIAKRSPNAFELTLKVEAAEGRRDELYLRKDALIRALQPLSASGREVFAPLGLDTWVPSLSAAPPPVRPLEALVDLVEPVDQDDEIENLLRTAPGVPPSTKV